jgi:hypothetical protein
MFDRQCAAENTKAPRTFKLKDIFVELCGMYAVLQLVCSVDPTERGDILIRIFENISGIEWLIWFMQNLLQRTYS